MGKMKTSEDRVKDLNEVDTLIQLFVQRSEEYFKAQNGAQKGYVCFDYEWASVKRISLELTRALAKLRKNEKS